MLFRKLLPLLGAVLALSAVPSHAQVGVYATYSGQRFGGVTCPTFAAPCAYNDGKDRPYGADFGAYYDFRDLGPVRLGVDVRGEDLLSNKRADSSAGGRNTYRQYDALAGVRGSFHTPITWIHPYVEVAGGFMRNNASGLYTEATTTYNGTTPPVVETSSSFNPNLYADYGLFKGFAGVDLRVLPWMDIRAIEFGAGEAFGSAPTVATVTSTVSSTGSITTSAPTTTTTSPDTHYVQSIGIGVVFRIP